MILIYLIISLLISLIGAVWVGKELEMEDEYFLAGMLGVVVGILWPISLIIYLIGFSAKFLNKFLKLYKKEE